MGLISLVGFLVMLVGLTLSMLEILTRIYALMLNFCLLFLIGRGVGVGFTLIWVSIAEFVVNWPS